MKEVVKPITIEKEYEKNPDISPEDIRKLREWLQTQPHLPGHLLTDVDLLITFHCCYKSQEVSKQVLDLHYTLRTMFHQFFKDRSLDKNVELLLNTVLFVPLPKPTLQGDRAFYARLLDPEPRNFNFVDGIRAGMMMLDLWQYEEGTFPGVAIIINMDQTTFSHITRLDLMAVKKVLYFLQECMLVKLTAIHFMNAPYFMDRLMAMIKPFVKKELLDMLHIHQVGSDAIYKFVPKHAFPKEDGGEYKDMITLRDELIQRFRTNHEFFREENKRRVNEALRKGQKPANLEKEFGIQGSFKKLDLD